MTSMKTTLGRQHLSPQQGPTDVYPPPLWPQPQDKAGEGAGTSVATGSAHMIGPGDPVLGHVFGA